MDVFYEETNGDAGPSSYVLRAHYDPGQRAFKLRTHEVGPGLVSGAGVRERECGIRLSVDEMAVAWPYLMRDLSKSLGPATFDRIRHLCELARVDPHFWTSQSKPDTPS